MATNGHTYILPCDHRDILTALWDREPAAQQVERSEWVTTAKQVVLDGLLAAVDRGVDRDAAAILMDDEYGGPVLERAREAGIARYVPVDTGEVGPFRFQYGEEFGRHVEQTDPDVVTALISFHPDAAEATDQLRRIQPLFAWLATNDRRFMLELQVPPPAGLSADDVQRWIADSRPDAICGAIRQLREIGAEPELWKLEGCTDTADYRSIVDVIRAGERDHVGAVVLGGGADIGTVDRWLTDAAGVDGFVGYAVGRSVWAEAIEAFARGDMSHSDAAGLIGERYHHFAETFRTAATPEESVR